MKRAPKITKQMDLADLPIFLRDLADALENGGAGEFACVEDFRKFKISGKNVFGKVGIKARFKTEQECLATDELIDEVHDGKPDYVTLKKRMKSSFRLLVKMIHDRQIPPGDVVASFMNDSALMVSYPGYGDDYYESYTRACALFEAAWKAKDMDALRKTIDVLIHEKSRCHAKYD